MPHLDKIKSTIQEVLKIKLGHLAHHPVKEASCVARDLIILTFLHLALKEQELGLKLTAADKVNERESAVPSSGMWCHQNQNLE